MISKWEMLSKKSAINLAESWMNLPTEGFNDLVARWKNHQLEMTLPTEYVDLRQKLVNAYDEVKAGLTDSAELPKNLTYQFEYRFALRLHRIMNEEGLNNRTASDDNVWRYVSMIVCPDLIYDRWRNPGNPKDINADRFYDATRRIWLKVLWWYVYLCWQGTYEKTEELIASNTANEISQLVERVGIGGYRVDLCREIIKYYDTKVSV